MMTNRNTWWFLSDLSVHAVPDISVISIGYTYIHRGKTECNTNHRPLWM